MRNKALFLSTCFFVTTGLTGCQMIKKSQKPSTYYSKFNTDWGKSHELFQVIPDGSLKKTESRVVFFRNVNDTSQLSHLHPSNISISIGPDKVFHVSLTNGHYSDLVVCNGLQLIHAKILNEESGDVTSYSKQYQLNPQTTTYLQVASSPEGSPILQNIPESEALLLLSQSTRQNHQISRVLSNCNG